MASVLVEVELDEIDTQDLLDELKQRAKGGEVTLLIGSVTEALALLEREHCPESIMRALRDWASWPIATPDRLEQWRTMVAA